MLSIGPLCENTTLCPLNIACNIGIPEFGNEGARAVRMMQSTCQHDVDVDGAAEDGLGMVCVDRLV